MPFYTSSPLWSALEMHVVLIGILGNPQTKMTISQLVNSLLNVLLQFLEPNLTALN